MTPIPGTLPHFLLVSVSSSTKKKKKEYLSELEHLGMMWVSKHNLERDMVFTIIHRQGLSGHVCTMLGETGNSQKLQGPHFKYLLYSVSLPLIPLGIRAILLLSVWIVSRI